MTWPGRSSRQHVTAAVVPDLTGVAQRGSTTRPAHPAGVGVSHGTPNAILPCISQGPSLTEKGTCRAWEGTRRGRGRGQHPTLWLSLLGLLLSLSLPVCGVGAPLLLRGGDSGVGPGVRCSAARAKWLCLSEPQSAPLETESHGVCVQLVRSIQ